MVKAYLLRDPADPAVVVAIGLFDLTEQQAERVRQVVEESERARHDRMAPHVAETLVSGLFDVVHTERGTATGDTTVVPLTERHLKPGCVDAFVEAMTAFASRSGGIPAGLEQVIAMRDTADPDHLIQLGIIRTDDLGAMRERMGGRDEMLAVIEPFLDSVGLDATYELVEELSPVRV
jgi:hypothetical protein